jgi:hypothetical protein
MDESMEVLDLNQAPEFEEVKMHDTSHSPCCPLWDWGRTTMSWLMSSTQIGKCPMGTYRGRV